MGATAEGKKELIAVSRRLPRERAELDGAAARSQAARPGGGPEAGCRRWGTGILGGVAKGVRRNARAALLGAQDGQRAQQDAQEPAAEGQGRPPRDLAGRDPQGGKQAFDHFLEKYRAKYDAACECSGQGSRRAADLLRLPGRALEAPANHQSDRVDVRDDSLTPPHAPREAAHDERAWP